MSVQQLYLLQKVDISINKLKAEAEQMKKDLLISPALEKATATATAASKVYRELLTNQDRAQVESDTLTSRIIQNEKRLYSGRVTNPKELSDISSDVEQSRQRLSIADEGLLTTMDKVDRMQQRLQQVEAELARQTDLTKHDSAEHLSRLQVIKAELGKLEFQRVEAIKPIDSSELHVYEQLMSSKGSLAVAEVHVGRCTACKIMISSSDSQRAHQGKELVHCSSCDRILLG
jgi:predicted  nucleic acid-binding Zn-ribbon protein